MVVALVPASLGLQDSLLFMLGSIDRANHFGQKHLLNESNVKVYCRLKFFHFVLLEALIIHYLLIILEAENRPKLGDFTGHSNAKFKNEVP